MRRRLLRPLLVVALAACGPVDAVNAAGAGDARDGEPLNVVVILADDLGWTDLGCQGSTFYETPHLDRLASEGVRFTHGYASGCVCSPTRAALMTGRTPARLDATDYFGGRRKGRLLPAPYVSSLDHDAVTLAEALREAGWRTGFFGKWHLGGEGSYPEDHGFEHNAGGFEAGHPPKGYFSPYGNPKLADGPEGEFLTERLTDEALAWMESVKDEPFLLYFSHYTVHTPLQAPAPLVAKYEAKRAALPKRGDGSGDEAWGRERERKVRLVQDHAVYAAMVESLDTSVGRVLAKLDELELAGRTLVVFTSDNGGLSTSEGHPTSNLPLRAGKGWLYEGGVRVPWIVRWPGEAEAGSTCDVPATSTDLYPTVLEAAGLPLRPQEHVDGRSLVPLLRGRRRVGYRPLFWHYPHYGNQGGAPASAILAGDLKLIEWFEDGSVELFDLAADPGETNDLAPGDPETVQNLRVRLAQWREAVGANLPTANPDFEER